MSEEKLMAAEDNGLHKFFKLSTNLTTNSMVLFDQNGCIRRFTSPLEIVRDFYELRLTFYEKRKQYLEVNECCCCMLFGLKFCVVEEFNAFARVGCSVAIEVGSFCRVCCLLNA